MLHRADHGTFLESDQCHTSHANGQIMHAFQRHVGPSVKRLRYEKITKQAEQQSPHQKLFVTRGTDCRSRVTTRLQSDKIAKVLRSRLGRLVAKVDPRYIFISMC